MPSASASAISSGSAGISSGDSSAITVTSSTPARTAARATSRVVTIPRRASSGDSAEDRRRHRLDRRLVACRRPQRGAGGVERHVAATDDDDPAAEVDAEAPVDVEQELDRRQHAVELVAGQVEVAPSPAPDGHEQRLVTVQQLRDRHVDADPERELDVDAELDDGLDLAGDEPAGEAVLGDAEHHHPAEAVGRLVDGHRMAGQAQLVRRREPRRSAADHADRAERRRWDRTVRLVPHRARRRSSRHRSAR